MQGLNVNNISMIYQVPNGDPVEALKDVSFDIKAGEFLTILGPSGCGKTTLLDILAGFLESTGGNASFNHQPINGPSPQRGMVFQQGALFEWMSVEKNVSFGPRMAGKPKEDIAKKTQHWLDIVGLSDFGSKAVYELSGGMQQRVALARCLANDPDLILMDEPLGALDALTREKMQGLLLKLWKETGKTIILITHSVEEALMLGERLFVMAPRPGRIEKQYHLPFAEQGVTGNSREIKAQSDFIAVREEILAMIWGMEEEIMGRKGEI
jgi:taurine transport system ATP-binding protein